MDTVVSIKTGLTRANLPYLVRVCLVATLGGLLFGYDTGVISGAIESLTASFQLRQIERFFAVFGGMEFQV